MNVRRTGRSVSTPAAVLMLSMLTLLASPQSGFSAKDRSPDTGYSTGRRYHRCRW
jgi:hypothetical protein